MQLKVSLSIFKVVLFALLISCQVKHKSSDKNRSIVLTSIIKHIVNDSKIPKIENGFLVSPYNGNFEFNSYARNNYKNYDGNGSQDEVLRDLNLTNESFSKLRLSKKSNIDYHLDLVEYSTTNKSDMIVTISPISEQLVFIEVFDMCQFFSQEEIIEENVTSNNKQEVYSLVLTLEDGLVKNQYIDNIVSLELQCGK